MEFDLLVDTASNTDNTTEHAPADATSLDFTNLEGSPANVTSSSSIFNPFSTFGQQLSSRSPVFGDLAPWSSDNLY